MSIQKKNGKYVPVVYLGKDPLTGKKIYKWGHYWERKKDAAAEENKLQLSKEKGLKAYAYRDVTFEALSSTWLELISKQKYSEITQETQKALLKKHLNPIFGDVKILDIQPIHVQRFINSKSELSPETQRKIFYLLKNILQTGASWRLLEKNPCEDIVLPRIRKKVKETWTPEQIRTFLGWEGLLKSKYFVMLKLAFYTGMRPGEIVGLTWDSVKNNTLHITRGIDKRKRLTDLKTGGSQRLIYIDDTLIDLLNSQKKWQESNKQLFGKEYVNSNFVFTHEGGSCITPQQLYINFKRLVDRCNSVTKANLPVIPLYSARHSFGTNAIEAGAEVSALSKTMGHATARTTLNNYIHPRDSAQQKVMCLMNEILGEDSDAGKKD